jgi:hypothetical protein
MLRLSSNRALAQLARNEHDLGDNAHDFDDGEIRPASAGTGLAPLVKGISNSFQDVPFEKLNPSRSKL